MDTCKEERMDFFEEIAVGNWIKADTKKFIVLPFGGTAGKSFPRTSFTRKIPPS